MKNLITALIKAQKAIKIPEKSGKNEFIKKAGKPMAYATLDDIYHAIRKPLLDNDLFITHTVEEQNGSTYWITTLMHVSGETLSNKVPLLIEKQTSQGMGSARTYACRYGICSLLGLPQEEDDDAQSQEQNGSKVKVAKISEQEFKELSFYLDKLPEYKAKVQDFLNKKGIKNLWEMPKDCYAQFLQNCKTKLEAKQMEEAHETGF